MIQASEKICDVLIEAGIDHVFGIPGGGTIPIWDALFDRQDKIKVVLTRHEQSAACMADMYGRITGKPGVLMGQGAFVASSGGFGILEGYLSNSPMLVLADTSDSGFSQHGNYQSGTGEYGSFDIVGILRSMSKYTTYAATPQEAVQGVQFAIKHAISGRTGPSCVVMRSNAVSGEIDPEGIPKIHATGGYLKESISTSPMEEIEKTTRLLLEAQRPVVIAGNGIHLSKAYPELKRLAEFLGTPVATSSTGKSAFPEVHPLALGTMGTFGQKVANNVIADADLLLVAGCRLSPSDTKHEDPKLIDPLRQKIIQIDIDPRNAGWNFPVEMSLVGDLKSILGQLVDALERLASERTALTRKRIEALGKRKGEEKFFEAEELYSDAAPLLPQRIIKEIEEAVDTSTVIIPDAGNNRLWTVHFFKTKEVRTVFTAGGLAGMGWGPPAALAAKLLNPDSPVLSVSSDGGFCMVPHVLSTAVQYNLPVVFLVMNNSALGMIHDSQSRRGRIIATEFIETDFAQIAQAFGCQGVNVDKAEELGPAIKKALRASVPTVIDVATSVDEPYFKIASM